MLKIWGRTNSINVQKVLWACGELGLALVRVDAWYARLCQRPAFKQHCMLPTT